MVDSVIAGRYRLEQRIGAGGMSEVWAGTDLDLGRSVAIKLLASDADPARFDREARAVAGLAHANVCTVYDYGEADGRRFIVLELLPGGSLEDRLAAHRPLPDDETRRIAAEIAAGLAHAHQRGVVHRDLKPANILFDSEGRAKIADFGIARTGGATGLTEAGTVLGTAAYISPEQARGEPATTASDVYAFGVILFRMLTGRLPFESPDALALAVMHRDLPVPPVSQFRSDAPAVLESVAGAALAKSPADRPRDGAALVTELGQTGRVPTAEETAATQILEVPSRRRSRLLLAFAVAAAAAAGVGLAMAVTLGNDTTPVPASSSARTTRSTPNPTTAPVGHPETSTPSSTSAKASTTTPTTSAAKGATTAAATTVPATTLPPSTATPSTGPITTLPPPGTTEATTTTPPPTTDTTSTTSAATTAAQIPTSPGATTTSTTSPG